MAELNTVEDTLFVPMLGRIYASENFPEILCDTKALELKTKLPEKVKGQDTQTQYTFMASAVRSTNMDRYIKDFMKRNPEGIIVQLGCGLETTFFRNDNMKTQWYELDLPEVIEYRREVIGESSRDHLMTCDAFSEEWLKKLREKHKDAPMLITASGLFYYFEKEKVVELFKKFKNYGNIEVIFDTVNSKGMKRMSKYMKQVGHEDAKMFFYVDSVKEFLNETGAIKGTEEPYYVHTSRKGLSLVTRISMNVSDKFMMVKMVHVHIN